MVDVLEVGRRQITEEIHQSVMVEPGDPFKRCQVCCLFGFPMPAPVDHLGLVDVVVGFGQGAFVPYGPMQRLRRGP
jgi:hypothetical protein